eukprot:scaffold66917_cov45-Prasinocladus_malaysianus.AAC.1
MHIHSARPADPPGAAVLGAHERFQPPAACFSSGHPDIALDESNLSPANQSARHWVAREARRKDHIGSSALSPTPAVARDDSAAVQQPPRVVPRVIWQVWLAGEKALVERGPAVNALAYRAW